MMLFRELFAIGLGLCYAVALKQDTYTDTWTATDSATADWQGIATSENGQYIAAASGFGGSIYQSSDYGQTWTQTISAPSGGYNWQSIASDSTGSQLVVASNGIDNAIGAIYLSSDTGATWTLTSAPSNMYWTSVCSSYTGQYLFAVSMDEVASSTSHHGGDIYVSNNNGETWNAALSSQSLLFTSVAVSANGQNAIAASTNGGIFKSSNFGVTWTTTSASTALSYYGVSSDSSGQYLVAVVNGGGIYYSLNNGTKWNLANAPAAPQNADWYSVTSGLTGQYVTATMGCGTDTTCDGSIYLSYDYGQNWYPSTAPTGSYDAVATSGSGLTVYTASYNGVIYIGSVTEPNDDDDGTINSNDDVDNSDSKWSVGVLVGVIVGGVVFLAVAGYLAYYFFCRSREAGLLDKQLLP